jgi:hypothetical protein
MKKIKKNIFGIGLALAMIMGIGFSFVPQKSFAEQGGGNTSWWCHSAYTWKMAGHLWYCRGNGTCQDVTGSGYGNQAVCNQAVGN